MIRKVYNLSVMITGIVSFLVWLTVSKIDLSSLTANNTVQEIIRIIIDAVFSYGFFQLIVNIIIGSVESNHVIKRALFSSNYIEGVWIGAYTVGEKNDFIVTIEEIKQSVNKVSVTGRMYITSDFENVVYRGDWKSVGATNVRNTLAYTFICNELFTNGSGEGFAIYEFIPNGKKPPVSFGGHAVDSANKGKQIIKCRYFIPLGHKKEDIDIIIEQKLSLENIVSQLPGK